MKKHQTRPPRRACPNRPASLRLGAGRLAPLLLALALAPAACDDGTGPGAGGALADVVSATSVDGAGPIWRSLDVTLDRAAAVEVYYQPVGGGQTLRMRADSAAAVHVVPMPRLLGDTTYVYAVRTFDGDVASDSVARGTFTTGPLPAGLDSLGLSIEGEATFPLLIMGIQTSDFVGQVGIRPDGRVVWYFASTGTTLAATPVPGSHDMVFIDNGRDGVDRVAPDGDVVAFLPRSAIDVGRIHHDVTLADSDHVLMIVSDRRPVGDSVVKGDDLYRWTMSSGTVEQVWSAWDFLDFSSDTLATTSAGDWLHTNSVSMGPAGNVIVSFFALNQVISIAPDFQSIQWRLGGPNASIALSDEDAFVHQHSVFELADGDLLIFDNLGAGPDNDHSRGLELRVEGDSAYAVWSHDPVPSLLAPKFGGIYRLENRNTVVGFSTMPYTVDEVAPDGTRVWRAVGTSIGDPYRAVPWPSLDGEEVVGGMP